MKTTNEHYNLALLDVRAELAKLRRYTEELEEQIAEFVEENDSLYDENDHLTAENRSLRKYEELVQFLFNDDLNPMAIYMKGEGYLMAPEEGFTIMEEYKQ